MKYVKLSWNNSNHNRSEYILYKFSINEQKVISEMRLLYPHFIC